MYTACSYDSLTLNAGSTSGWTFDHWSKCPSPAGSQCTSVIRGTASNPTVVQAYFRDVAPPNVDFTSGPAPAGTLQGAQNFSGAATDNDAVANVTWTVTSSSGAPVASGTTGSPPYAFAWDTTRSANGTYNVSVYATDRSGNRSAVAQRAYTVANPLPSLSVTSAPNAYLGATSFTFAFSATGPNDVVTSCLLDGVAHGCAGSDSLSGLSQGAHTWRVTATDHGGNATSADRSFIVDTVDPSVSVTGGPVEGGEVHTSDVTFTYTASDANGVTVQCYLDAVARPCAGGQDDLHSLSVASHTWIVRATDPAGNATTVTRHFNRPSSTTSAIGTTGGGSTSSGGSTSRGGTSSTHPPTAACLVPNLRGKTLAQARKLLGKAHCRLGKVTKRKADAKSRGRVVGQHPGHGKRLAAQTKVAVTLGR
jgi:hypothetical protein